MKKHQFGGVFLKTFRFVGVCMSYDVSYHASYHGVGRASFCWSRFSLPQYGIGDDKTARRSTESSGVTVSSYFLRKSKTIPWSTIRKFQLEHEIILHDMMTWWHDDMMTWWHDDMMTWWHDDTILKNVVKQRHFHPLKFAFFGWIVPPIWHDDIIISRHHDIIKTLL